MMSCQSVMPRVVVPAAPRVPDQPDGHVFTNDAYFGTSDVLSPVPSWGAPGRPPPEASRGLEFELPPPPYVWRQPGTDEARQRPEYVHRPGPVREDLRPAQLGLDQEDEARGSVGTGLQLLAVGPQNVFLDVNPEMSFFKPPPFKRHTASATECVEQGVDVVLGRTTSIKIWRRGHMLGDVLLQVRLPNLGVAGGAWVDAVGYVLMSRARLIVDEVVIHDHERLWYDLVDRLFEPHGRRAAIDAMIGRGATLPTDREHTVFLPFKFSCCKGHEGVPQFLPLVGLATRSTLVLELTAPALGDLVVLPAGTPLPAGAPGSLSSLLLTEQTFVEQDEQRAAWQQGALLMVEQPQDVDALSYKFDDTSSFSVDVVTVDLRELNLPVRSLVFVAYDENAVQNGTYFQYVDCVKSATLLLGSDTRFATRSGAYFSLVQTYQHAARCAPDNVHMYSFALDASSARQPCGALNFAAISDPSLRVELRPEVRGRNLKIKVFAQCVNWLSIERGSVSYLFAA